MDVSSTLNSDNLQTAVHMALTAWNKLSRSEEELLSYLLQVQEMRVEMGDDRSPAALRRATNQVLLNGLDELAEQDEVGVKVLHSRFIDGEITRQVANKLHASPDQVNRWQRATITNLSQIILSRELALREARAQQLEISLPPLPYTHLFGFDQAIRVVSQQLLRMEAPWVTAVVGIGGIGKTSLSDYVTRQAIRTFAFAGVIWLRVRGQSLSGAARAPQQMFETLLTTLAEQLWPEMLGSELPEQRLACVRQVLKTKPYLIVVDNLETEAEIAYLLEHIGELAGPTRYLLTTRVRPPGTTAVFTYLLEELSLADTAVLLRHHATTIGLEELAQAPDATIQEIHDVTGGNPLALKLVVGLAVVLPLPQILIDLTRNRPGPIEDLYRHIYWEAWRTLSQEAQALLQAMPLVAEAGALPEQMQTISGLSEAQFWPTVRELVSRSLLEAQGTIQERRYGIHRLTETFLRTEIIHWPEQ